jgi:hypothetical protein
LENGFGKEPGNYRRKIHDEFQGGKSANPFSSKKASEAAGAARRTVGGKFVSNRRAYRSRSAPQKFQTTRRGLVAAVMATTSTTAERATSTSQPTTKLDTIEREGAY